jgi:hypothetical protein
MIGLAILAGMAFTAAAGVSPAAAQSCYFWSAGGCVAGGSSGLDSSCRYQCRVTVKNGKRTVMIKKDNRWQRMRP